MKIELISTDDLKKDRAESIEDIANCEIAIKVGVKQYSGGRVSDRLEINKKIVAKIDIELNRRVDDIISKDIKTKEI